MFRTSLERMTTALLLLLLPGVALAHEGHGSSDSSSLLHYLTEPVHAVVLLVSVLGLVFIHRRGRATKNG